MQQVIIEIFIYVEHEMKRDLFGVHHFLYLEGKLINIPVLVFAFHQGGTVKTRNEVLGLVGALPAIIRNDSLRFVVDVVNRCPHHLSVNKFKGSEHGDGA